LASELNRTGYIVRAYDQRGHGESVGAKGCLPARNTLIKDLTEIIEDTRTFLCKRHGLPLVVLGHSMGGLVSALWVAQYMYKGSKKPCPIDALVLSSPAFEIPMGMGQQWLLTTLPRWMPNLTVSNGWNPDYLSHDPDVVAAYKADPLVHDRISPRLGEFLVKGGQRVFDYASKWQVPTLLLYGGNDRLVSPEGSRRFAQLAPKEVVQTHYYPKLYHEIFNELHRQEVLEHLLRWLERRY
jgi:alpha-beta hydrolase superfamily lysophospholipase